jgi:hypothetical protein
MSLEVMDFGYVLFLSSLRIPHGIKDGMKIFGMPSLKICDMILH